MGSIVTIWLSTKSFLTSRHRRMAAIINIRRRKTVTTKGARAKSLRKTLFASCAFLWLVLSCSKALAHDPGLSAAEVRILADAIVVEVSFAPLDLKGVEQPFL